MVSTIPSYQACGGSFLRFTSLPPDVELGAGWDACIASLGRPAAQEGIKALIARGYHKPGDVENRLGNYLGQIAR